MASETPADERHLHEDEPLLGDPGDAMQRDESLLAYNLLLGTAVIAQAGIWILAGIIWVAVFSKDLILFSAHPLLNSAGILFIVQGILVLQPTHTPRQKQRGTWVHASFNDLGVGALLAGLIVIEYNKFDHNGAHFKSPHAILGLITYALFVGQALIGFTQYFTPGIYGSVDNAKSIYKYHRASGYVLIILTLCTVAAATKTQFNEDVLHIELWAVIGASVLILAGLLPRIKKQKLGFK